MPRRRLGVVVVVDPPVGTEVDGLRRAVGDGALPRIAPHLTLVPPVNVVPARVGDALGRLRAAAAAVGGPFDLRLGPVSSFLPANPVLLLEVGGDLEDLRTVRDVAFSGPFERPLSWPWVPHVTLADDLPPERIAAATRALDRFTAGFRVTRITVLEERRTAAGHRWEPFADATVGRRRIVGRGSLELELTGGRVLDPEAVDVLAAAGMPDAGDQPPAGRSHPPLVVTARCAGEAVGVAAAWVERGAAHAGVVVHPAWRRQGVGGHLLAALSADVDAAGWDAATLVAHGPAAFYAGLSARFVPGRPPG